MSRDSRLPAGAVLAESERLSRTVHVADCGLRRSLQFATARALFRLVSCSGVLPAPRKAWPPLPRRSKKKLLDPMRSSGILCRAVGYLPRRGRQACALYTTGFTELGVACAARLASAEVGAIPSTAGSGLPASRAVNARRPLWCGPTARPWDPLSCLWSPCRPGRGAGRIS